MVVYIRKYQSAYIVLMSNIYVEGCDALFPCNMALYNWCWLSLWFGISFPLGNHFFRQLCATIDKLCQWHAHKDKKDKVYPNMRQISISKILIADEPSHRDCRVHFRQNYQPNEAENMENNSTQDAVQCIEKRSHDSSLFEPRFNSLRCPLIRWRP